MRALVLSSLLAIGLLSGTAWAGSGGVRATGFGAPSWDKDTGGVYLAGKAWSVYRFSALRAADDSVVTRNPLWTGFDLEVRNDGPRALVGFSTSVRGGVDLGRGGYEGEVLTAQVDLAPAGKWFRLRLGRQLLTTNGRGGFTRMDGGSLRVALHYLAIEAYAGIDLRSRAFALPSGGKPVTGWGRDFTYGFAFGTTGLKDTQLRVGIQDRRRDGRLARRHLSIDLHKGIATRVNVRGNLSVDLLQRRLQEAFVGVDARPLDWLAVGGEYERWQPSFDATTIWSVFASDPFDTFRGHASITPLRWLDAWLAGGVQVLPLSLSKDNVPFAETGRASGTQRAGIAVRPLPWLSVRVDEQLLGGAGGTKLALSTTVSAAPMERRIEASVRGDLQRYAYELQPGLEGWYGGAMVEVAGRPLPWVRLGARGEAIFTPFLRNNWQLMATLEFDLGLHIRATGSSAAEALMRAPTDPALTMAALDGGVGVQGGLR